MTGGLPRHVTGVVVSTRPVRYRAFCSCGWVEGRRHIFRTRALIAAGAHIVGVTEVGG